MGQWCRDLPEEFLRLQRDKLMELIRPKLGSMGVSKDEQLAKK